MKKLFILCMVLVLTMGTALADSIMIYGTIINTQPQSVVCTADGMLQEMNVTVGDHVATGSVIATVATNKVYATTDGTVYLFGEVGDKVADIAAQYGAVAYIVPAKPYTITAAAQDYNGATVSVVPGEMVYLRCYKDGRHTGVGILAKMEKDKYTVIVMEGEFVNKETVSIYRDTAYTDLSRIGRGKIETTEMTACQGEGYLVKLHVQNGSRVEKGSLLYETISGIFTPDSTQLDKVISPASGIVSAVYKQAETQLGSTVSSKAEGTVTAASPSADHVIAEVYPDSGLRVLAYAPESVLNHIRVGDSVYVSRQYIENMEPPVVGTVEKISRIPAPENSGVEAQYAVYVMVSDASCFYYGMNVVVTTGKDN